MLCTKQCTARWSTLLCRASRQRLHSPQRRSIFPACKLMWVDPEDFNRFHERTTCMERQFVPGPKFRVIRTPSNLPALRKDLTSLRIAHVSLSEQSCEG